MVTEHFQLQRMPFERDVPCDSLYRSEQVQQSLARLLYVSQQRSMGILTGEVGAGKSTLLRLLKHHLDPNYYFFVYIADSELSPRTFYYLVLLQLGVTHPPFPMAKLKSTFKETVTEYEQNKGMTCVVVIDEAQDMTGRMMKELRYVLNFQIDSRSPLALILAGQSELYAHLQNLYLAAVRRRVDAFAYLSGMSLQDTQAYVGHQLREAGAAHALFPNDVVERIHEHSKGILSTINTLCKRSLIDAAGHEQKLVEHANLERAAREPY